MNPKFEQQKELEELKAKVREYFKIYANEGKVPGWCDRIMKVKAELSAMVSEK